MGCVDTITAARWPAQGSYLGKRVRVCFHYDTARSLTGVIVRDDAESPHETIIALDDGRFVRSAECQYTPGPEAPPDVASTIPAAAPDPLALSVRAFDSAARLDVEPDDDAKEPR